MKDAVESTEDQHKCLWAGCQNTCPLSHWGCAHHWKLVPADFKRDLIALYRPGQEIDKNPSEQYIDKAYELWRWTKKQNKIYGKVP